MAVHSKLNKTKALVRSRLNFHIFPDFPHQRGGGGGGGGGVGGVFFGIRLRYEVFRNLETLKRSLF